MQSTAFAPNGARDPSTSTSSASRHDRGKVAPQQHLHRVLVIDDDADSATSLRAVLAGRGYDTSHASDATSVMAACRTFSPDLAILDGDMTKSSTLRMSLQLAEVEKLPFIIYAESNEILHKVMALQLGADNYLHRPMDQQLLIAHVDAAVRRVERHARGSVKQRFEFYGPYRVDRVGRTVQFRGNTVRLCGSEFELFWMLANQIGQVVDRRHLISSLQLSDHEVVGRAIDQRMYRLRHRLVASGAARDAIRSVRGRGFVLADTVADGLGH